MNGSPNRFRNDIVRASTEGFICHYIDVAVEIRSPVDQPKPTSFVVALISTGIWGL